ncbi:TonB-dependent receptor plug domain-containing protein [Sphingomonas sp. 37zxx]|uniref:TonB-dependent receptor plug domain-containing protein n=1 Tax=Sphingomonas sp. 37zxx TaxID=1550073 RepID=UPI0018CC897B|nr:TonB-dependent receptor [Sphingomonas sp. 37zxx]
MNPIVLLIGLAAPLPAHAQTLAESAPGEQIVVTGTRTPRTVRDAPIRTDIIGETVLTSAAPRNLADALDYLAGARTENNCQNCNTTEIQLLGLPGAYNQILLDGLPLVSGVAAVYGVEQFPAVLIDRIEVVKGGGSALYGPGALAGVVNLLPIKPTRSELRGQFYYARPGASDALSGSLVGTLALRPGSTITAYGQAEDSPAVDLNGDGYSELAQRRLYTAGLRATIESAAGSIVALDYQFTDEARRGGNLLDQPAYLANIAEEIDSRAHRASISVTQPLGEATLTGVYALSALDRDSFYGGLGEVETDPAAPGFDAAALADAAAISRRQYGTTRDTLHFGEVRLASTRGAHDLLGGVQYRTETVDDRNVDLDLAVLATLNAGSFSTLGAFVQDEWTLTEGLRLLLGARIDKSSVLDRAIVSPRMGLWWSPSPEWVVRANYSTGYRAPEIFSEDVHVATLGADPIRVRNAAGLRPEKAGSFAIGFDWRPAWSDGALTIDGQAYRTVIRDTFFLGDIRSGEDGALFQLRENAGGSNVTGAELNFSYRASERLQLIAGGAWLRARYDTGQIVFDDGARQLATRDYLKSPNWSAVGQVIWRVDERLDAFAALRYTGPMDVLNNRIGAIRRTPSFVVADLTATRHIPLNAAGDREIDLTFGLKNATDARQRDLEVGAARDSDYVYGPRNPRTLFMQARALF